MCSGGRFATVHDFPEIPVRRCLDCSFMHSARTMRSDDLERYYDGFGSDYHRLSQRLVATINHRVMSRLLDLPRTRSLLDVGTGYGYLPALLRDRYGIRVTGVDLSRREVDFAVNTLQLDVHCGRLADAPFEPESFDVVSSFEVIEHVADPVDFVQQLAARARPGGRILIGTDNFGAWVARRLGAGFPMWIPHAHISHFTPSTLRRCIECVDGLTVERECSYTAWEHLLHVALAARRRRPIPPAQAFDLRRSLATEFDHDYRFATLRHLVRHAWFSVARRSDPAGAYMWMLARKRAG